MDLNIMDLITLEDDKQYVITSKAEIEGNNYLYLVDVNENENIKFCKLVLNNGVESLVEIVDDETLAYIMPTLYSNAEEEFNS